MLPFIWIFVVKAIIKPVPGSNTFENKSEDTPFSDSAYKFTSQQNI